MSEKYGPHLEELMHTALPPEDLSGMTYPRSLDQHTRVKDREEALDELAVKHPTTKIESNSSLNKTGKMLMKRGDPEDDMYFDPDGSFSPILNIVVNEGGSAYIPDIMEQADVPVTAIIDSQIPNVLEIDKASMELISKPLQEHIRGLNIEGQTAPYVEPIMMRPNTIYTLGFAD